MTYDFNILPDRRTTESDKWLHYPPDVLPLWVADMDFVSPEPVIHALQERVTHGVFGYPATPKKLIGLVEMILERLETLYHWNVKPEDVQFIPGVVVGLNLVCQALVNSGENVLVQPPVYPPFLSLAKNAGVNQLNSMLVYNPTADQYQVDWDSFEATLNEQTRLFVLCNPHNPVGRVFQRSELARMAESCLRHNVRICADEIHCDLIFSEHQHIPIASLDEEIAQNTITLMAPSKTYNLAGLNFSFAIIQNDSLRRRLLATHRGLVGGVNVMGIVAAQAAYRYGQEWLDQLLDYLEANRNYLYGFIKNELPSIHMTQPEGTYLAWLDCRQADIPGNPFEFFLENARVALNDGKLFGPGGEGFVRLNFGCPRPILTKALQQMKQALDNTGKLVFRQT